MAPLEVPSSSPSASASASISFVLHTLLSSTHITLVPTHRSRSTIQPSVSAKAPSLPLAIQLPTTGFPVVSRPPSNDDSPDAPTSWTTLALIIAGIFLLVFVTGCYRLRQMDRRDRADRIRTCYGENDMIHRTTSTTTAGSSSLVQEEPLSLSSQALDHGSVRVMEETPPPPYERHSRP